MRRCTSPSNELLVLGPENSGKSLLINRLKQLCIDSEDEGDHSEATIPTVGVDISTVEINGTSLTIREIGATMASKWDCYMSECSALLFVIDASDLGAVASDLVLLHEILSNRPLLFKKPFAILFNKTDLVEDPSSIATIYNVLRIEEIQNENRDFLDIILLSGSSIAKDSSAFCVRAWLQSSVLL